MIMMAYIARDPDGIAYLFKGKPHKESDYWYAYDEQFIGIYDDSDLPEGINPQWSDDEPIEVELKIEKI